MPVHQGKDSNGTYYQWGSSGKKYYYSADSSESKSRAKNKAENQGQAAYANGYKGK